MPTSLPRLIDQRLTRCVAEIGMGQSANGHPFRCPRWTPAPVSVTTIYAAPQKRVNLNFYILAPIRHQLLPAVHWRFYWKRYDTSANPNMITVYPLLQPWIYWLTLHSQHVKYAFMNALPRFATDESLQRFDAQCGSAHCQGSLRSETT